MEDKIDCNNINEIREKRNENSIYTGLATSCAYVQSSSNPLEIFHSLCKTPLPKSEPHRDNPSLVFRNP